MFLEKKSQIINDILIWKTINNKKHHQYTHSM